MFVSFPSGLVLYWLTTNLWTGGQQVVLKRRLGPLKLVDPSDHGFDAPSEDGAGDKEGGGFRAQMKAAREDAARKADERQKAKKQAAKKKASTGPPRKGGSSKSSSGKRRPPKKR